MVLPAVAAASAGGSVAVTGRGCAEINAFVEVPAANIDPLVPDRYQLALPDSLAGQNALFIDALHCSSLGTGDDAREAVYATVAASIEKPPWHPETVGADLEPHFYLLSWATNDDDFFEWLRDGTGLGPAVRLVHGLSYDDGATFAFSSPPPSPMPFELLALRSEHVAPVPVTGNYWRDTAKGTVRIQTTHDPPSSNRFGLAAGTVTTPTGSDLGAIFAPFATRPFNGFASTFEGPTWRKQVVRDAG